VSVDTMPILSGSAARPKQASILNATAKTILLITQFSIVESRGRNLRG
jgi:hypothetical protein